MIRCLRSGDLNLNRSVQACGDSNMERLKQAMVQHEVIFRNQVCELHRLYWTQKNLMNELRVNVVDAPCSYSWLNKVSEEKKNAFSKFSRAQESSLARNLGALEEYSSADLLKNNHRQFSLHLSADDFVRNNGEGPAFYHQATNFGCKGVVDLESSVELKFHDVTNNKVFSGGCRAPTQYGAGLFGVQANVPCALVSSSIIGNDKSRVASVIHLSEEHGGQLQEQRPALPYVGIGESCIDASVNQPRKKQQARPILFDLNALHEETSFVANPPFSDTAANILCKDLKSICSLDSKLAHNTADDENDIVSGCQIQADCCEGSADSNDLCKLVEDNVESSTDKRRSSSHCDIKMQDSNITSSSSINLAQTVNKDSVTEPSDHEGSEEGTSSSHAIAQDEISPSRNFLIGCGSHGPNRTNEPSNTDDSVTTQLNSSQNEGSLQPEERDTTILSAARALMSISLVCSAIHTEQCDDIDTINLPEHSSDSFECLTMQLCEVQSEARSIVTKPSNENETVKNERGVKLRRGRGFRDFQKEILPGLVTLSRHEICEDLQAIGYKLMTGRPRNGRDNWFVPVRSRRRSDLCSGRRRRLSSS